MTTLTLTSATARSHELGPVKRFVYWSVVKSLRTAMRLSLDWRVIGRERIPAGPKLFVANHISAFDPIYLLPLFDEPVCAVLGPAYKFRLPARLYNAFGQINAMPAHRHTVVDEAVARLKSGRSVLMFPEGDLQPQPALGRFYPGTARIYRRADVPIVPLALVAPVRRMREYPFPTVVDGRVYRCVVTLRGPFIIHVGEPMRPDVPAGRPDEHIDGYVMELVRQQIAALIDGARPDASWL